MHSLHVSCYPPGTTILKGFFKGNKIHRIPSLTRLTGREALTSTSQENGEAAADRHSCQEQWEELAGTQEWSVLK